MAKGRARETTIFDPREFASSRITPIGPDGLIGSVVKVGDGRGFVVADGDRNIAEGEGATSSPPRIVCRPCRRLISRAIWRKQPTRA
jgi:hypothetical protein